MQDSIGIPACFSIRNKPKDSATITKSRQSVFTSVYKTNIADQCRLITVTWCKDLLLHGFSVSVYGPETEYACKVELKPWNFWRKQGAKSFVLDGTPLDIFWDLKSAKFHRETEPVSDFYIAVVSGEEVVLLIGDMKKDAYRKTGRRPSLIDAALVSRTEHVFGKKKFQTRVKFHEKGGFHEVSIEFMNINSCDSEMEIKVDGELMIHVKHLQWKFRGNDLIHFKKATIEVYWDVHAWLFSPGLKHALFVIKPSSPAAAPQPVGPSPAGFDSICSYEFCLFLYAWKIE